jgi:hypothetical protein
MKLESPPMAYRSYQSKIDQLVKKLKDDTQTHIGCMVIA